MTIATGWHVSDEWHTMTTDLPGHRFGVEHLGRAQDEHLDDGALEQRDLVLLVESAKVAQILRHLDEPTDRRVGHVEELNVRRRRDRLVLHRVVERHLERVDHLERNVKLQWPRSLRGPSLPPHTTRDRQFNGKGGGGKIKLSRPQRPSG